MTTDEIDRVVETLDLPYQLLFRDYNELGNYNQRGSYFWHMDLKQATIKMTRNAKEHGLSKELITEFLQNSSPWQVLIERQKNEILKNFEVHSFSEFAISDLIDKAYSENDTFSIRELKDMHERVLKIDQRNLTDSIKKFQKPVILSLVKEFTPVRISYPGDRSTVIIAEDLYIRPKNYNIYFSSSSNGTIRNTLNWIYNNTISSKQKDEIIRQIQDLCEVIDFESATRYIKFQNDFVFDVQTQEITAFNPDFFIIRKFNFDYEPAAKGEKWLDFINSSIAQEDISVLQEFFGYIFYYGLPAQNFLILKGPTRSGKGTTLRVLESLIGAGNFSAVPASSLFSRDDSGHNLASLEGMMANFDGEVPPRDLLNIANLKKLTGADPIWANEKYKIPHYFLYKGKLIFALNSLPKIKLNDNEVDSFFSRVLIINYLKSHINDMDPNLDSTLAQENSGIFNWALEGLKRLKSNNFRFSSTQNLEQKQRLYTLESDPLKVFSEEVLIPGDGEYEPKKLYTIFLNFCNDNHIDPSMNVKSLISFQRQIVNILKIREDLQFEKIRQGHDKTTYYTGFCIKELENSSDTSKVNEGLDNFNADSLPDGPVKQSLMEEQEQAQSTDNKTNKQPTQEIQKSPKIPKNPKMCYYKIMDHFDAYPDSYFDVSDIILDSYRPIYHKNSSNLSYILLKVLIPENLSQQPGNWMKFLSDSQEISQKAFETLSRGDAE